MIIHDKAEFVLCSLSPNPANGLFQQALDLNFTEGEEVTFYLNGEGLYFFCHLTSQCTLTSTYDILTLNSIHDILKCK